MQLNEGVKTELYEQLAGAYSRLRDKHSRLVDDLRGIARVDWSAESCGKPTVHIEPLAGFDDWFEVTVGIPFFLGGTLRMIAPMTAYFRHNGKDGKPIDWTTKSPEEEQAEGGTLTNEEK